MCKVYFCSEASSTVGVSTFSPNKVVPCPDCHAYCPTAGCTFPRVSPRIILCPIVFRIHCYPFHSASAAVVGSFFLQNPLFFPFFLHHVNVLLLAPGHTMSVLATAGPLSLKTFAFAFAFAVASQSMKIGLISKCFSCLFFRCNVQQGSCPRV